MPKDIAKLKRERSEKVQEARTLLDSIESRADKKMTVDENARYDSLETEIENRNKEISREEKLVAEELRALVDKPPEPADTRNFGEFLLEVRNGGRGLEARDVTASDGPSAGFLIPEQYERTIRQVTADSAIIRPRAMVIPAGDPPDAEYNMVALDQSGTKGVYSGVAVKWTGETSARQDGGGPTFRTIKLKPNEVSAYIDISDKALRNAMAAGQMCQTLLRAAIIGSEEDTFYTGGGVGMPLGIIGHSASIEITRTTASTIKYADVVEMFARSKGTYLVWVMSKTALPQIMKMEDTEGHLIWQANAAAGPGGVLLGIPVMFNDQSPVLGSTGDLALIDFSYYAIKDGSPLAIFMDPYTQKVNGLTRIYAFWNVDGQPTLTTPMLARDGVTTYSPFVVLK